MEGVSDYRYKKLSDASFTANFFFLVQKIYIRKHVLALEIRKLPHKIGLKRNINNGQHAS